MGSEENLESRVTVNATLDEMDELFNDTQGGFSIRYFERTECVGENGTFKVVVRHGDDIRCQDGKIFDYKSFIEKFDDLELRAGRSEGTENRILLLETDVDIAKRGIEGGLSQKTVEEVLKIYGTHRCKEKKYVKAVLKSEKMQSALKKTQEQEMTLDFTR